MHHYAIYVQNISLKGYQWYLMRYIINNLIQYKYLGVLIKMSKISPKLIKITVVMSKTINQRIFFMSKFTYFSDKPFFVASNWVNFFCGAICYCDGLEWNNPNSMLLLWKVQRSKGPLRPLQGYPVLTHKRILCPVKRVKSWCEPLIMFVWMYCSWICAEAASARCSLFIFQGITALSTCQQPHLLISPAVQHDLFEIGDGHQSQHSRFLNSHKWSKSSQMKAFAVGTWRS